MLFLKKYFLNGNHIWPQLLNKTLKSYFLSCWNEEFFLLKQKLSNQAAPDQLTIPLFIEIIWEFSNLTRRIMTNNECFGYPSLNWPTDHCKHQNAVCVFKVYETAEWNFFFYMIAIMQLHCHDSALSKNAMII